MEVAVFKGEEGFGTRGVKHFFVPGMLNKNAAFRFLSTEKQRRETGAIA
jgi:hypothetical protein